MNIPRQEKLEVLDIDMNMLSEFLEDIDQYEFQIKKYPPEYSAVMPKSDFLFHLYSILQNYVTTTEEEGDIPLAKIMVLYGVSVFKQKAQTNKFLICFLQAFNRMYAESPEVEFVLELINAFMDDRELMKIKLKYMVLNSTWMGIKNKVVHHYLHSKDRIDYPLEDLIVNCNDWVENRHPVQSL